MSASMAEVLAQAFYNLGWEVETSEIDDVAAALAAAGYGKLPEPVTEWGAAFRVTGARYNSYRTQEEAEAFVKSMNEVDADMVVITRQHTPATNTEWMEA